MISKTHHRVLISTLGSSVREVPRFFHVTVLKRNPFEMNNPDIFLRSFLFNLRLTRFDKGLLTRHRSPTKTAPV